MKALKNIPTVEFDGTIANIMSQKSRKKLSWNNNPVEELGIETKTYRECNYRCCPESDKAKHLFCLVLDRDMLNSRITVLDGFLASL
jgi:hypothetical protein